LGTPAGALTHPPTMRKETAGPIKAYLHERK
jgi:hypothetical protein